MRGEVVAYRPDRSLAFTWSWADDPEPPPRQVRLELGAAADGTVLELEHGTYRTGDAEDAHRRSHREGWEFFLPKLADRLARAD